MRLGQAVVDKLRAQGKNPYLVPVGGSSALGTWGYLQASEELRQQTSGMGISDVVMACGSGGTSAGLCLGLHLAMPNPRIAVHAYGVCDDPDYFYDYIDGLLTELGVWDGKGGTSSVPSARGLLRVVQARGTGYAMSTDAELQTMKEVAEETGVILDPVYSGKAIHGLIAEMRASPQAWQGRRVLFLHTGGLLGMYDKEDQLRQLLGGKQGYGHKVERLEVNTTSSSGADVRLQVGDVQHGMMQ
ncbi:tryptophan synthase beta subunit-like PLP-dependent enzyme [Dunaliella salina]|nr:tryptophan synthase beta subunit-like PLP-dependent enzyme [Dunaliella salina]|eukprot:KAF5834259.1 tryptophan synthase beta subunit-like PLP-dependent enzyme [Dunaliella salina]